MARPPRGAGRSRPVGVYVAASIETRQRLYPGYGFDPRALPRTTPFNSWPEDFRVPVYIAWPAPRIVLGPLVDRPRGLGTNGA